MQVQLMRRLLRLILFSAPGVIYFACALVWFFRPAPTEPHKPRIELIRVLP